MSLHSFFRKIIEIYLGNIKLYTFLLSYLFKMILLEKTIVKWIALWQQFPSRLVINLFEVDVALFKKVVIRILMSSSFK